MELSFRWEPPPSLWVKLNSDCSSLGNPGPDGAGCVLRNECGGVLFVIPQPIPHATTSNMAEFMALAFGLKVLTKFRHNSNILEMDSQLLHKTITGCVEDLHWTLAEILFHIRNSLAELSDVRIVWNYREMNKCADVLAGFASKMASSSTWFTTPHGQLTKWPTHGGCTA
ncbi:hypothetical protein FRX31_017473 [Thalictrum thalictroides]|uniref:RNase H type-1 domain-containing protein n=1 Tax=Thalictrum thalictroides TaxID=46969 RepID=A0A7J6W6T3_THATH|nr:hypothetical protein FRX31_017473 [Thalictrum thalictroides]